MKQNVLRIVIAKPVAEVFRFSIDPSNTPLWAPQIAEEIVSEIPVKFGTVYKNRLKGCSDWRSATVSAFEPGKVFELTSGDFRVRYTYKSVAVDATELEYVESIMAGELNSPITMDTLTRLKEIIESQ